MTTPTPADAVRAALAALQNATDAEIAAAAIQAAVNALLPRPARGDKSKEADKAFLLRLQFLGLVTELFAPLPAASQEALAEAREKSQSAAWGDIEPDQVLPAVEALARSVALTAEDITPGPYSEQGLRDRWNSQANEFNAWDSLDSWEQLAWAQNQAIAADRAALSALALPPAVDYDAGDGVKIEATNDERTSWAVRHDCNCLNTSGEWEYEVSPSHRSAEFLARTRWPSPEDANSALLCFRAAKGVQS